MAFVLVVTDDEATGQRLRKKHGRVGRVVTDLSATVNLIRNCFSDCFPE